MKYLEEARTHRCTITHTEDTRAFTDNHKPAAPILKQQPVLTRGLSLVVSLASAPFISAWWLADEAMADVCIFPTVLIGHFPPG